MKIDPIISGSQYIRYKHWHIYYSPKLNLEWLRDLLVHEVPLSRKESDNVLASDDSSAILKLESDSGFVAARYYFKSTLKKKISSTVRQSEACVSWFYGHHLMVNQIRTPAPLAMMEERKIGVCLRSWYLSESDDSIDCESYYVHNQSITPAMANIVSAIVDLFISLRECHLSHGNIKAGNILISPTGPSLTGNEKMAFHANARKAEKMFRYDIETFMDSWDEKYSVYKHFKQAFLKRNVKI